MTRRQVANLPHISLFAATTQARRHCCDIGRFAEMPELKGPLRCDLHARWNRDGTAICFDSTHENSRQMYLVDVSSVVRPSQQRKESTT